MSALLLQFVRGLFRCFENAPNQRRTSVETTLKWNWNETERKLKLAWDSPETVPKQDWNSTGRESTDKQWACFFNSSFRDLSGLWYNSALKLRWNETEIKLKCTEIKLKWNRKETGTCMKQSRNRLKQHWNCIERESTVNQAACFFYRSFTGSFRALKMR